MRRVLRYAPRISRHCETETLSPFLSNTSSPITKCQDFGFKGTNLRTAVLYNSTTTVSYPDLAKFSPRQPAARGREESALTVSSDSIFQRSQRLPSLCSSGINERSCDSTRSTVLATPCTCLLQGRDKWPKKIKIKRRMERTGPATSSTKRSCVGYRESFANFRTGSNTKACA